MKTAFQIGKVMGIPIRLHITFLAIIPWFTYMFAIWSTTILNGIYGFGAVEPPSSRWIYSFAFSILLFVCIALHELGHSYVAMRHGIVIKSITLYLFGGVASIEEIPRDSGIEMQIALAGPSVSLIIGILGMLLSTRFALLVGETHPLTILLWSLGFGNLMLAVFNLLPAFPTDGGRVFRAWLATKMPYVAATSRAANLGKMFAILMAISGLFNQNFLLILIAFFVYIGASEEERAATISVSLGGIRVRDIMSRDVRTIPPTMNLKELTNLMFSQKHRGYPVTLDDTLVGIVTIADVQRVSEPLREITRVEEVMTRKIYVIGPDEEASVAMKKMINQNIRRFPVLENGKLVGILSRSDLLRAIELSTAI